MKRNLTIKSNIRHPLTFSISIMAAIQALLDGGGGGGGGGGRGGGELNNPLNSGPTSLPGLVQRYIRETS